MCVCYICSSLALFLHVVVVVVVFVVVGKIRKAMADKYPNLSSMVKDEDSLTLALNEEYVASGEVIDLKNGDTIALIPPISGG